MDTNLAERVARTNRRGMRYQHRPIEFKRALVEQSLLPGVSVSRLAREHGVNANQFFNWRKIYQAGGLDQCGAQPCCRSRCMMRKARRMVHRRASHRRCRFCFKPCVSLYRLVRRSPRDENC